VFYSANFVTSDIMYAVDDMFVHSWFWRWEMKVLNIHS